MPAINCLSHGISSRNNYKRHRDKCVLVISDNVRYRICWVALFFGQVWIFGDVWCSIWLAVDVWMCTASILNLCAISLDRYVAVTRPVKYPSIMSSGRAKMLIAGVYSRNQKRK
jgi:hypothetical protein